MRKLTEIFGIEKEKRPIDEAKLVMPFVFGGKNSVRETAQEEVPPMSPPKKGPMVGEAGAPAHVQLNPKQQKLVEKSTDEIIDVIKGLRSRDPTSLLDDIKKCLSELVVASEEAEGEPASDVEK